MKYLIKLKPFLPIFILLLTEIVLFYLNYAPGTFFLGWDNLFPEMNFSANITRSIFAIWEEYRGLGLLDGMSFAANLVHYIFLYLASFFLPMDLLRYFFIFFMHFLGGVGIYFLINELFKNHSHKKVLSFLGALFYLFNLATIQMFYAQYETFAVHFAFLPLLLLFVIKYLSSGKKIHLAFFAVLSLLATPQAHVPTLFIVYCIALFTVLIFHALQNTKRDLKKIVTIILLTVSINTFWGLPYAYSTLTNAKTITNSKINQMSTEDVYLKNKAHGNLWDVALMRGFWFDYVDTQNAGKNDYIMPVWRKHSQQLPFILIGFSFFFLALWGCAYAVIKKDKKFYPFIALFIFSFLMLGNDIPYLKSFSTFFSDHIPYFFQAFRFTFTKFSILYVFSFSILLVLALSVILNNIKRFKYGSVIIPASFMLILLYYSLPVFQGQFIYKNLRVEIPKQYFELVNFFKLQGKNERIATLPQSSFWGWTYTNWGYRGSGFIWFGIAQPSLDGAFLPWSKENENYYWELTQAVYSSNKPSFEAVLEKYQINWVVVDQSIISPYSSKASGLEKLETLISNSGKLRLYAKFGTINIYRVNLKNQQKNFIFLETNLPNITPKYQWNNYDAAYIENGNYITQNDQNSNIFYPFRSVFTGKKQEEIEFKIYDKGDYFSLYSKIPTDLIGASLIVPKIYSEEVSEINKDNLTENVSKYPQIYLDNEVIIANIEESDNPSVLNNSGSGEIFLPYIRKGELEIRLPKIKGYYSYSSVKKDLLKLNYKKCDLFSKSLGESKEETIKKDKEIFTRLTNINSSTCFDFDVPFLSQRIGYLATVKSSNLEGKSLLFAVINKDSEKPDLETNLPNNKNVANSYFIIPPMNNYGLGYNFYFDNTSIGNPKTINNFAGIEINPIPYRFLTSLKIVKKPVKTKETNQNAFVNSITVNHPNPSLYKVELNKPLRESRVTLILSQSFDKGWKAYEVKSFNLLNTTLPFIFGKEIKNHVLVNNWENGWEIEPSAISHQPSAIVIVYLPQYLEYAGFVLLALLPFFLILNLIFAHNRLKKLPS